MLSLLHGDQFTSRRQAVLAMAGFDACSPVQSGDNYWDANTGSVSRSTSFKRTGTGAADVGAGSLGKTFASHPVTIIVSHAHYLTALNVTILELMDTSSNRHISVTVDTDGTLRVRRGTGSGTILGSSSAGLIPTNAWFHLELKVLINDTTGTVEARFNGVTKVGPLTSQDTANSANIYVERVLFSNGYVDDVVIRDTSGATNNDFGGDEKIETIFPNAAGDSTDFTPSTGSNWQNVDDATPDDDTTYNESSTVAHDDLYNLGALATTSGSIKAVMVMARMRKTDAGTRTAAIVSKSGATTTTEDTQALGESYVTYRSDVLELNPDDAAAWAIADVNALQAGVVVVA